MRRVVIGALLGLPALVAPVTAHAAPAVGEIVVVSNGHAYGYLTLPARTPVDFDKATWTTRSEFALLVGYSGGRSWVGGMWVAAGPYVPGFFDHRTRNLLDPNAFQKGRTRISIATDGPTTVRIPARGVRGRITVRLGNRLAAHYTAGAPLTRTPTGGTVSAVMLDVRQPMWVVNGFARDLESTNSDVASQWNLCTSDLEGSGSCGQGAAVVASVAYALSFDSPEAPWRPEGPTQAVWTMASAAAAAEWHHLVVGLPVG